MSPKKITFAKGGHLVRLDFDAPVDARNYAVSSGMVRTFGHEAIHIEGAAILVPTAFLQRAGWFFAVAPSPLVMTKPKPIRNYCKCGRRLLPNGSCVAEAAFKAGKPLCPYSQPEAGPDPDRAA